MSKSLLRSPLVFFVLALASLVCCGWFRFLGPLSFFGIRFGLCFGLCFGSCGAFGFLRLPFCLLVFPACLRRAAVCTALFPPCALPWARACSHQRHALQGRPPLAWLRCQDPAWVSLLSCLHWPQCFHCFCWARSFPLLSLGFAFRGAGSQMF